MKFVIGREKILEPLLRVSGVVEKRQTLPVLANLLLVADNGQLSITGTDQEVEMSTRIPLDEMREAGEITLPGRKLVDICRSLTPGALLAFSLEDNRMKLHSGRFTSHLATLPAIDFPKVEIAEPDVSLDIAADVFAKLLHKTDFAMAQQDVRYFFNGMLLEFADNLLRAVATNGQRLATTEAAVEMSGRHQVIVPRKAVIELGKMLKDSKQDLTLNMTSNHLHVSQDGASLTTKLVDAAYPDYNRAIPASGDKVVSADRKELKEALGRISILCNEMYRNVRLQLSPGELQLHANNPLQEEAEEKLGVDYEGEGLEIGFNVGYMIDVLNTIEGEKVTIAMSDANSAALLTDPEDPLSRFVISPMML